MGGAERNARKRKQEAAAAAKAVAAASRKRDRTNLIAGIVVVVVIAVGIIGSVLLFGGQDSDVTSKAIPKVEVNATYPVKREGDVIVAGKDTAKATIDLYADFLCPGCRAFEERDGSKIQDKLNAGELKVRYHMVPLLVNQSTPAGYSLEAANAALAITDAAPAKFPDFFASLYAKQPREKGPGYTNDQLIQLGRDLGVQGEDFANAIRNGAHKKAIEDAYAVTQKDPVFGPQGFPGTPSIVSGGKPVEHDQPTWLDDLLK
ncbi:protein-disulfide isomerase [Crossiella equi]|uniref:Protein-disulfide isomerase n=1 Tax=Crossiella equi TaxID=130796 RepID=A0ABS5AJ97_9PSEU|nr:thioredoxin domain-containing protein [Crossiella equi]MBP2476647.1 protein-disulfide isomerase [Crossiella equi]